MAKRDAIVFGLRAAQAVADYRPESILRVLYVEEVQKAIGPLLKATAAQRKPYRQVTKADLDRVCSTPHHEGIAVIAQPFHVPSLEENPDVSQLNRIIVLDDVSNPHNVGAVARTAAWFGFDGLILNSDQPFLNPAAIRVSQGGVFSMTCFRVRRLPRWLDHFRKTGATSFALTQNGQKDLNEVKAPSRFCLVFGNERIGIRDETLRACEQTIVIPGKGKIESLNISVAAGIAMAQLAPR